VAKISRLLIGFVVLCSLSLHLRLFLALLIGPSNNNRTFVTGNTKKLEEMGLIVWVILIVGLQLEDGDGESRERNLPVGLLWLGLNCGGV
jgi:hypothetical protein